MLNVGLTGGIGSGKTTAANMFKEHGVPIIDADIVARELTQPGTPAYEEIVKHFGIKVLDEGEELDRNYIRFVIFNHPNERTWLEKLLHPMIRERMQAQAKEQDAPYVIFAIPLLAEKGVPEYIDYVVVVDIDPEIQLIRTELRDSHSMASALAIIKSQSSREERLSIANDVLNNDGSMADLRKQVSELHEKLLKLAEQSV